MSLDVRWYDSFNAPAPGASYSPRIYPILLAETPSAKVKTDVDRPFLIVAKILFTRMTFFTL